MLHKHIHHTNKLHNIDEKVYLVFERAALKELHNTAFTFLIIPGIESTASAKPADATSISPSLQQSTIGASSTATHDKGETTKGTEQYKKIT